MTLSAIRERAIAQDNADAKSLIGEIERLRSTYMRDYAARMLDVRPNVLDFFEIQDPLNPQNEVLGFLSHQADHRYGALAILQVNSHDCPQVVYATPKLHYPFAKDEQNERRYRWPVCERGRLYEKADGTNCLVFSYADHNGKRFVTAKVRLGPFLRNGKFGPFLDMWKEMVQQTSFAPSPEVISGEVALSFEMYGYRNFITLKYPFPLKITLLFGVRQKDAAPIIPEDCPLRVENENLRNPCAAEVDRSADLTVFYEKARADAAANCREIKDEEGKLEGTEGYVLYLLTDDKQFVRDKRWILYKAKPDAVEQIHWYNDTPSYKSILPTAWNALETVDIEQLDYTVMKQLLLEEFAEDKIEAAKPLVEKAITAVKLTLVFRAAVREVFDAAPDKSNRRALMRHVATSEDRFRTALKHLYPHAAKGKSMQIVYAAIIQQGLIPVDLPKEPVDT